MKLLFVSLGCDKNLVDTEVMLGLLDKRGWQITDDETQADVIVINTCCFVHDGFFESVDCNRMSGTALSGGNCERNSGGGCSAWYYIL